MTDAATLRSKARPRDRWRATGWKFAAPALSLIGLVIGLPLVFALLLSLSSFTVLNPGLKPFVGAGNYAALVADPDFRHSVEITLLYCAATVTGGFCLGLGIALLLMRVVRLRATYFAILAVPVAVSPLSAGLIWHLLLQPERGIVNQLLGLAGIAGPGWLGDPGLAFWTLVFVEVWQQAALVALILSAGLAARPVKPYEAASVDGAGRFQQFWYLTLPMLRPVAAIAIVIQLINAARTYDLVYALTRGGPDNATDLLSYYAYRRAFLGLSLSEGSAVSFVLLLMVLVLTLVLFRLVSRRP